MNSDVSVLRNLVEYQPETGLIVWRERRGDDHWNRRYAGACALNSSDGRGYKQGLLLGRKVLAHRAAWALFYGQWPSGEIDHIDGDRSNNRICNLRIATKSQNQCNSKKSARNNSGFKGVHWNTRKNMWQAQIMLNKRQHNLGYFETAKDAHAAYAAASERMHGEFGRTH